MIKRNKLSIFLIAVVMMLTIYYIKTPSNDDIDITIPTEQVQTRYAPFAEERIELLSERETSIIELESILAQTSASIDDKYLAIETIAKIEELTEKELVVETAIINIGYEDALVSALDNNVEIKILTDSFSTENFVEVALIAKEKFGNECIVKVDIFNV